MTVGAPLAALLAALAVPVVIAFLTQRKSRKRVVSRVTLFRVIATKRRVQRRMASLRQLVALALILLCLLALLIALLDVQLGTATPQHRIVVLDASASMGVIEPGQSATRLSRASDEVRRRLRTLEEQDQLALITVGPEIQVRAGLTRSHETVLELLDRVGPVGEGRPPIAALDLARSLCEAAESGQILWVSDSPVEAQGDGCPVVQILVGGPVDNVGLTGLAVRKADAFGFSEIYLEAWNQAEEERRVTVDLLLDETLVEVATLDLPARGSGSTLLTALLPQGEVFSAQLNLDAPDALSDDDRAWVALQGRPTVRTLLVSDKDDGFLAEALRLHPQVDLAVLGPEETSDESSFDLILLEKVFSGNLPDSNHIVAFGDTSEGFGLRSQRRVANPEIVRWSFDDPLFRYVDLENLNIQSSKVFRSEGWRPLIEVAQGPIAVIGAVADQEILAIGLRVDATDLALRVGFVNWIANIVEWASPEDVGIDRTLGVGERWQAAPEGAQWVPWTGGAALSADEPVKEPGVYTLQHDGVDRTKFSVNLLSAAESSLPFPKEAESPSADPVRSQVSRVPWWPLLALALLALLAESALPAFRFRRTRAKADVSKVGVG